MIEAIKILFSKTGVFIVAYLVIGILVGPPQGQQGQLPSSSVQNLGGVGHWFQFFVWVLLWPVGLIFHHPAFTL